MAAWIYTRSGVLSGAPFALAMHSMEADPTHGERKLMADLDKEPVGESRETESPRKIKTRKSIVQKENLVRRLKSIETWDDKGRNFGDTMSKYHAFSRDYTMKWSNGFPTFHPKNTWRQRWDVLGVIFILYNAVILPQDMSMYHLSSNLGKPNFTTFSHIADAFFILDVVVTFRTGLITIIHGVESCNMEAKAIAATYIKTWLTLDLLSIGIPFGLDQFLPETWSAVIGVMAFLKFFRLGRLGRLVSRLVTIGVKYKQMARICVLIILYVFFNYLLGSFMYWLGNYDNALLSGEQRHVDEGIQSGCGKDGKTVCTWTNNHFVETDTYEDRLYTNLYFSVTTSTSVGYGDISGVNNVERFFLSFMFVLAMLISSITSGSVVTLLDRMGQAEQRHQGRLEAVEEFVNTHDIEESMAMHIRATVEYEWLLNKFFDLNSVLLLLPIHLRKELLMEVHKTLLMSVPFFQDQDQNIMKEVVGQLEQDLALAGDTVIHEGECAERMYFINVGEVNMMAPHALYAIGTLGQHEYFGEVGLLVTHGRHSSTIVCKTRCQFSTMSKNSVKRLCNVFPEFKLAFRDEALKRLKEADQSLHTNRPDSHSEHRLMVEIVKANSIVADENIKTYAKVQLYAKDRLGNFDPVSLQHTTNKIRGTSPSLKYVCGIVFHCHAKLEMSQLFLRVEFWQCHAWREDTYLGTAQLKPASVQPGTVHHEWHYLEDLRQLSEFDKLWRMATEQGSLLNEEFDLGQVLIKMVRHRDGHGEVSRMRAIQAMNELSMLEDEVDRLHELEKAGLSTEKARHVLAQELRSNKSRPRGYSIDWLGTEAETSHASGLFLHSVKSMKQLLVQATELSKKLVRIQDQITEDRNPVP